MNDTKDASFSKNPKMLVFCVPFYYELFPISFDYWASSMLLRKQENNWPPCLIILIRVFSNDLKQAWAKPALNLLPVCRAMYLRYWTENFRGCLGLVNLDCQGVYMQFLLQGRFRGTFLCLILLPVYSFQFFSYSSKILALGSW